MKLPTKIKILDAEYTINYVDDENKMSDEGNVVPYENTINIYRGNRSLNEVWQTLWHEWIHMLKHKLSIKIPKRFEEAIIDQLALGVNLINIENQLSFKKSKKDKG